MVKRTKPSIIAVIDIGTTKVVCFIAKIDPFGRVNIVGIGHNMAYGFKAGKITDVSLAEKSVSSAVEAAEKMGQPFYQ